MDDEKKEPPDSECVETIEEGDCFSISEVGPEETVRKHSQELETRWPDRYTITLEPVVDSGMWRLKAKHRD